MPSRSSSGTRSTRGRKQSPSKWTAAKTTSEDRRRRPCRTTGDCWTVRWTRRTICATGGGASTVQRPCWRSTSEGRRSGQGGRGGGGSWAGRFLKRHSRTGRDGVREKRRRTALRLAAFLSVGLSLFLGRVRRAGHQSCADPPRFLLSLRASCKFQGFTQASQTTQISTTRCSRQRLYTSQR